MRNSGAPPQPGWRSQAECVNADPELFFPVTSGDRTAQVEEALAICRVCRVRQECLEYAVTSKQEAGIWGGATPDERRGMVEGVQLDQSHQLAITPQGLEVIRLDPRVSIGYKHRMEPVVAALARAPHTIDTLDPRTFEELVAFLLERKGFHVQLTKQSRDHGVDIYASHTNDLGENLLFLVQCKRYSQSHPVGVGKVRDLFGAVSARQATHGVLVTNSFFSRPAKEFVISNQHRLTLRDRHKLEQWIRDT